MTPRGALELVGWVFLVWCAAATMIGGWLAECGYSSTRKSERVERDQPGEGIAPFKKHARPY